MSKRRVTLALAALSVAAVVPGTFAVAQPPLTSAGATHFETYGVDGASAWGDVVVPSGEKARVHGWIRDDKCDRRNAALKITFDYPLVGTDKNKWIVNNTDGKCGASHLKSFDVSEQTYSLNAIYVQEYTDNWYTPEQWGARIKVWEK
ncbi:hypothetical protein Kfla_5679 [Kribbella flavida DSM 17836]|uniref:Secreted protein n=1 Tax=Kribbella flavida (strain DSM 17836 / JCM 10339 / NBRC 14399) TaxID=479435 RepID=D2PP89_KRIFD|nr:hypothetical protein [Kribbella flavida]ADB34685.1 hypothetical protein Kfla_5679 [Kribbella flavida DSM 17836]